MNKKIYIVLTVVALGIGSFTLFTHKTLACGFITTCPTDTTNSSQLSQLQQNMAAIIKAEPIPQVSDSQERANISKRAQLFNSPDKLSYIYLISYGKVMAFYTVQGKVSSLNSYMTPQDELVDANGNNCSRDNVNQDEPCFTVQAPDVDGSYGTNPNGIFFFTTEGAYVEWEGDYMMSDQPLKLSTPPELVRDVK